ncbi:hypothetical protein [Erythrobacter dokdonensis]|uniref:Putative membrane protein n=1 Tax=Erythrobacter dokdonensis DSW-74 TaxID=1300349 RepID=A0A1A7BIW3_9SPHN|nr:hypothetical protein [Erythrobacter dokdonensis]OBV11145.1 putative membrane protein [Erythrobacter dokdonensis DSW-74]
MSASASPGASVLPDQQKIRFALDTSTWLIAFIAVILVLQFGEVFRRGINWDEFHHYHLLWELHDGRLNQAVNTAFTRALVWIVELPGDPIDHIIALRVMMFGFELTILAAIVALAERFSSRTVGLICALAYITFPYVFGHGYSFRFDPPVTALTLCAAWIIMVRPMDWKTILAAGAMIGLSSILTIKIVLLAPAFAGLIWLRWSEHSFASAFAVRVALLGVLAIAIAGLLYLAHLGALPTVSAETAGKTAGGIGNVMFALEPKPFWGMALSAAIRAPLVTLLVALFVLQLGGRPTSEKIALAGMFATITTLIYYHNTAPYFYVFMLPWVLIACSVSVDWIIKKSAPLLVGAILFISGVSTFANEPPSPLESQRQLIRAAQEIFPDGLAYFDFMGMLPRLEKANPFMTFLTIKGLQTANRSIYSEVMAQQAVPLLMSNDEQFDRLFGNPEEEVLLPGGGKMFTAMDREALLDTYIPFWGPFLLAGEIIPVGSSSHKFGIRVPGPYTVAGGSIMIGGSRYSEGDIVNLERGMHEASGARQGEVRLVWGRNLEPPAYPPPERPYAPAW